MPKASKLICQNFQLLIENYQRMSAIALIENPLLPLSEIL
jgi:hypothetical protein